MAITPISTLKIITKKKKKEMNRNYVGMNDCLTLTNQTIVLGGMFQPGEMDSANVEKKKLFGCTLRDYLALHGRPHGNKQRISRDYGIVHQELASP